MRFVWSHYNYNHDENNASQKQFVAPCKQWGYLSGAEAADGAYPEGIASNALRSLRPISQHSPGQRRCQPSLLTGYCYKAEGDTRKNKERATKLGVSEERRWIDHTKRPVWMIAPMQNRIPHNASTHIHFLLSKDRVNKANPECFKSIKGANKKRPDKCHEDRCHERCIWTFQDGGINWEQTTTNIFTSFSQKSFITSETQIYHWLWRTQCVVMKLLSRCCT